MGAESCSASGRYYRFGDLDSRLNKWHGWGFKSQSPRLTCRCLEAHLLRLKTGAALQRETSPQKLGAQKRARGQSPQLADANRDCSRQTGCVRQPTFTSTVT